MSQEKTISSNKEVDLERRSFLEKLVRIFVLVLLGSFIGKLVINKRISPSKHSSCINNSICARCRLKSNCMQPQAQSFRSVNNNKDINR